MVKTPITRPVKPRREPLTIDHGAAAPNQGQATVEPEVSQANMNQADRDNLAAPKDVGGDATVSPVAAPVPQDIETTAIVDISPSDPMAVPTTPLAPISDPDALLVSTEPVRTDDDAAAYKLADEPATESGTAAPADDEFGKPEPIPAHSGSYRFGEPERKPADMPFGRSATTPAPPPPRRGGLGGVAAGILGGLVAAILFAILLYSGLLASFSVGNTNANDLQADLDALKQQVAALKAGGDTTAISGRLDTLEPAVAALQTDVAALKQGSGAAPAQGGADADGRLQAFDDRLKSVEQAVAGLATAGQGAGGQTGPDMSALDDRVAAAETVAKAAADTATALDHRLSALEQAVNGLSGKVDSAAAQPKVALAIATAGLKSAVDRGGPFTAELDTFAAVAPDAPEIAPLRAHAATGVSSMDDLLKAMDPAASAMIAAANPVGQDAGVLDRLWNSAEGLISVRPIGAVEGTGVDAIVARMEAALKGGDLSKALSEYGSLPDGPKAAGAALAEKIAARRDVEALVAQATAAAMKA